MAIRKNEIKSNIEYDEFRNYLLFLYKKHSLLELEIMLSLFLEKGDYYFEFISGKSDPSEAKPFCDDIVDILLDGEYLAETGGLYDFIDVEEKKSQPELALNT